jgi:hypothetical protein
MIHFRSLRIAAFGLALAAAPSARAEDWLDRVDEALSFANDDASVRARFSGLLDIEGYHFTQPSPGLIFSDGTELVNPRLTLFFDAQLGPHVYVFAQSRLDRGFDPSDSQADFRLDEYAVRWSPWDDARFNVQVGKFASVVGNWSGRHQSWDNPFINAPLAYETMTAIYDSEAPSGPAAFLEGIVDAKYEYNPVIWGPSYASGIAISGTLGHFDYAFELKNAPLSSRPESWRFSDIDLSHPTLSGRLGYRPTAAWYLGLSASEGAYFIDSVEDHLPFGTSMNDFKQIVIGQDISYAWHHWQLWAECYEARFQVPRVGHADSLGYYLEAKYKFTPQFFAAMRWNQQLFASVRDEADASTSWGDDLGRIDCALAYRFTPHTQLKLQYALQHAAHAKRDYGHLLGVQFTVRF